MERSNFIKLLEEYKTKALAELYKESKVQASLLLSDEFKIAISELEKASEAVNTGFRAVSSEVASIVKQNSIDSYHATFYCSDINTGILEKVLNCISDGIRHTSAYRQKESEIKSKFDAAIRAAKATRSAAKLKELADALGIDTPSIEVTGNSATTGVDTEFVKEKIKAVALLR
jgi:hypothetical protein